jgi:hypothetical protein
MKHVALRQRLQYHKATSTRNLGAFVATHGDRKFDRVTRHGERVFNGLAERVDLWKCRHNNLKGVLVRLEQNGIAHIHAC